MQESCIYLKDYQPPVFGITSIHLDFDLYDDHALVENRMLVTRQTPGALCFYGEELELVSILINDAEPRKDSWRIEQGNLWIDDCPDDFTLTLVTKIYPQNNTQLSGLFRSKQLFCTQCEAEGFRRMTFFPDRPDVLSVYTTKITADKKKYPILLSNGNLIDSGDAGGGRHWVVWQDPFKKPSYLFALVAGNLAAVRDEFTTASGKKVDLIIYVEPGNEDKCAHAMTSLKKSMRWDEEVYGREYDLSIFMIVAVSDFNMGAMENKGLNIFNSKFILARPDSATDQDYADVEGVVAHEYFHNWTGNRVTCRDWFQLSLKEGLTVFRDQEFSRDMNFRDVFRILDVKILRAAQFPEDAGGMAHPVRPASYQEISNFYTATVYNKGAEVIRMQHTLLGAEGFRRGMDLYFERHDGQAVTIDDFVAAMQDANKVDFGQFTLWYSQAGTPEVTVESDFKANILTLTMTQTCPPTPECKDKKPFHIPIRIALFDKSGKQLPVDIEVLELREKQQTFIFTDLAEKPVISLLRDFSAPIKLFHKQSIDERLALLRFETNGYAKWDAAQQLILDCLQDMYQQDPSKWQIPAELIDALVYVLADESLDKALKADLLTPPGFEDVAARLPGVDVTRLEAVRDHYRKQLSLALFNQAKVMYQALWLIRDRVDGASVIGERKLRNTCLWLMMKANEEASLAFCQQQFAQSRTMTDQIASFGLLVNCSIPGVTSAAVDSFYSQWKHDDLVLDKWFAIQATSELPGTLDRVKQLLDNESFSITNPNKVRSLLGAFIQANPRHFHAADGSGYAFLGDMLIKLDKLNPQVASSMAKQFTRWRQFDPARGALMKEQLARLQALELSRDLSEVVSKSLLA